MKIYTFCFLKILTITFLLIIGKSFGQVPVDTTFLNADIEEQNQEVKLLPEKLGPIKKVIWGEKGLMRITKISNLTPEGREKELKVRRRMLVLHQIMGFVTLASMLTSDLSGQLFLSGHDNFKSVHLVSVKTTIGTYFTTAGLALFAPPPMILRRKQWDAIRVHKLLAALHFSGMVLTPLIAPGVQDSTSAELKKNARFHQISAYTTTALFASAIIVVKF